MSLIPSESLNFPDSFRANVGWHLDEIDDKEGLDSLREGAAVGTPFPPPVEVPKTVAEPLAPPLPTPPDPAPPSAFGAASSSPLAQPQVETDDQQLELLSKTASEGQSAERSPGPVEMNAVLDYFLAAGATSTVAPAQPNGETVVHVENVATVADVIPTNVAIESPRTAAAPNEPLTVAPVNIEPVSASPPPEPKRQSAIASNARSSQQSIVAALESLSHTDVEPPIGSVEIQTPAQANHILELIAAAVQRGALVGETVPESHEPAPQPIATEPVPAPTAIEPTLSPATPPPAPRTPLVPAPFSGFSIAREPVSQSTAKPPPRAPEPIFSIPPAVVPEPATVAEPPLIVSEPAPIVPELPPIVPELPPIVPEPPAPISAAVPPPPSPIADVQVPVQPAAAVSAPAASAPDIPQAPAKIRITPRKIRPRPQEPPTSDERAPSPCLGDDFPTDVPPEAKVSPVLERRPAAPVETEAKPAPKSLEPSEASMRRPELSARKIAAARLKLAQSDLFLFSARERRNRWIGFGLSELAVVTALVLLGRYGFTHHFPDPTVKMLVFILIFAAAAVAIALPIAFFHNDPRRWDRAGK